MIATPCRPLYSGLRITAKVLGRYLGSICWPQTGWNFHDCIKYMTKYLIFIARTWIILNKTLTELVKNGKLE